MSRLKVMVVTIGDERQEFYNTRLSTVREENEKLRKLLQKDWEADFSDIIYTYQQANECISRMKKAGNVCIILHLPVWGMPSLAPHFARASEFPVVLLGNTRPESSSLVSLLAAAGMLDQAGLECIRIAGEIDGPELQRKLKDFITACKAAAQLRESRFCAFGGRSIGIGTGTADPMQWQRVFGVDFDHCDQLEIVRRAKLQDGARTERYLDWLTKSVGSVRMGQGLTKSSLERQIRSYLAMKDIVQERGYDFAGIKCQTELSDGYALQCVGVALMNGSWDAEGEKKPIPVSCECDCDGALTMYLLSLSSCSSPSSLSDIKLFSQERREFVLANCGSMAPWFANRTDPVKALGKVNLLPHVFGKAGGAAMQFVASDGDVTVARLCRSRGKYVMHCFEGRMEQRPLEELRKTTWCYPHQFIRADINYEAFFQTIGSNHLHTVYGKYKEVLRQICAILKIGFICYNE